VPTVAGTEMMILLQRANVASPRRAQAGSPVRPASQLPSLRVLATA
jgi:hypothetical protein